MMQKAFKSMRTMQTTARMFSYNYRAAGNPQVWMDVSKDGQSQGRMVFELYATHTPEIAENFAAFCNGSAANQRSFAGSSFAKGQAGLGIQGGFIEGDCDNYGASNMRVADENLEMRHHKRGLVTMVNEGPNSNGSQFMITFGEANYLNGYNNVVGEIVSGDNVLAQMEKDVCREGKVHAKWAVSAVGEQH